MDGSRQTIHKRREFWLTHRVTTRFRGRFHKVVEGGAACETKVTLPPRIAFPGYHLLIVRKEGENVAVLETPEADTSKRTVLLKIAIHSPIS